MDFPKQPWVDGFKAAGLRFEDIDYVFCTHLHIDHTGWNTMLRNGKWVPTFPKAKYIFHKREYAAWEEEFRRGGNRPGGGGNVWGYNCEPVVAAGQALLVDDDYQLDDTFTLTPTPGHSPCHCCVMIRSQGQQAIVTGDMMHHALQCREPDWSTIFDTDPVQAALSRRRLLEQVADTGAFVLPIHFPNPTTIELYTLMKPQRQHRTGLMPYPQPGELDHGGPCTRISRPTNPPIAVHTSTLVGHRRDADVARNLPTVVERSIEYFACQHGREVIANASDATESGDLQAGLILWRSLRCLVAFRFDLPN